MGKLGRASAEVREFFAALPSRARENLPDLAKRLGTPQRLQRQVDGATRVGQILAFVFIGPVVVVSLVLIVVLNTLMTDIFGTADYGEAQGGIIGWLITAITAGAFLMAAWSWFQFVRTAGFGWFNFD